MKPMPRSGPAAIDPATVSGMSRRMHDVGMLVGLGLFFVGAAALLWGVSLVKAAAVVAGLLLLAFADDTAEPQVEGADGP